MATNNRSKAQYEFVKALMACGHSYATLESYESATRSAIENFANAGTSDEEERWNSVCQIVDHMGELLFGEVWKERRRAICREVAVAPVSVKH